MKRLGRIQFLAFLENGDLLLVQQPICEVSHLTRWQWRTIYGCGSPVNLYIDRCTGAQKHVRGLLCDHQFEIWFDIHPTVPLRFRVCL